MSELFGLDLFFFSECDRASSLACAARSHSKLLLLDFIEEMEVGLDKLSPIDLLAPAISHDFIEHLLSAHNFD